MYADLSAAVSVCSCICLVGVEEYSDGSQTEDTTEFGITRRRLLEIRRYARYAINNLFYEFLY